MRKFLKVLGKILNIAVTALLAVLVAVNLYTFAARKITGEPQPTVFGYASAVVLSGSMEPAISVNDMVIIHKQQSYELQDVVMYEGEHSMITHRIVGTNEGAYITRGDANNTDDPAVPAEKVVGKVVLVIPKIGAVIGFLQTPLGMLLLVLAVFLIIEVPAWLQRKKQCETAEGGHEDDAP